MAALGLVAISLLSIVLVMLAWPTDRVDLLGVDVEIGAQRPDPGFGLAGPGELESFGESVDIRAVEVVGPVRPYIGTNAGPYDLIRIATTEGASQQAGDALVDAYRHWALLRTPVVLGVGLVLLAASVAVLSFVGRLPHLHRRSWRRYASWAVTGVVANALVWAGSLGLAVLGSSSLADVRSLEDVFDYDVLRTSPAPTGLRRPGYDVVVIGDSRAAVYGGTPLNTATPDDEACFRSTDSLAAQIQRELVTESWRALNLACWGATVDQGLLQEQRVGGRTIPSQVGQLKNVEDPEVVVVSVGPNDIYWGPIVGSCYVTVCNVRALAPTVDKAMIDFARSYDDLLADLDGLDGRPQVIVVDAYQPFLAGTSCEDTRLPDGSGVVTPGEIATISDWRDRLNSIMSEGAAAHEATLVSPQLVPLCVPDTTGLGPDIWPLASEYRFHPTAVGVLKTASTVVDAIDPDRFEQQAEEDARAAAEAPPSNAPSRP